MRLIPCNHRFLIGLLTSLLATSMYGTTELVTMQFDVDFELSKNTHKDIKFDAFINDIYLREMSKRFPGYNPEAPLYLIVEDRKYNPAVWGVKKITKKYDTVVLKESMVDEIRTIKDEDTIELLEKSVPHEPESTFKITVRSCYKLEVGTNISYDDFSQKAFKAFKGRFPDTDVTEDKVNYYYDDSDIEPDLDNDVISDVIENKKKIIQWFEENPIITLDKTVVKRERGVATEQGTRVLITLFAVFAILRSFFPSQNAVKQTKNVKIKWVRKKKKKKKRW